MLAANRQIALSNLSSEAASPEARYGATPNLQLEDDVATQFRKDLSPAKSGFADCLLAFK